MRSDPALFQQEVKYEQPPSIFTHRSVTPVIPRVETRKLAAAASIISDDGSTTSEMSGHDSESIYETIRVFTPKQQCNFIQLILLYSICISLALSPLEDDDDYRTAGVDEVEIEIKDLVRLQKANPRSTNTYDDILLSTNLPRQRLTPRGSSVSSSSTLNNLVPTNSQYEGAEEKEETVTETIKTQQIQTTFRQIGQNLDDSAFFIPLTSSTTTYQEGRQNDEERIRIPISTSTIRYDEQPALQHQF